MLMVMRYQSLCIILQIMHYVLQMEILGLNGDSEILHDLERQAEGNMRAKRGSDRIMVTLKVILRPGNSSELIDLKWQGVTGDISAKGCRTMFPLPAKVGDVYRLEFEHENVTLPMVFARCMRCQLIREDGYEAGFKFFSAIDLSSLTAAKGIAKDEGSDFI